MQGKDQRPKSENKTRTRTKTKTNTNRAQDQDQHQKDKDKEKQQGRHADTNRKEARTATTIRRPRAHKTSSGLQHKTRDKKLKKKRNDYNMIKSVRKIIKPRCMFIPDTSIKIHGITNEIAKAEGNEIETVLTDFLEDLNPFFPLRQ